MTIGGNQIDRKNDYRQIKGLYFPHYESSALRPGAPDTGPIERNWCKTTLVDGELVLDKDKFTGQVGCPAEICAAGVEVGEGLADMCFCLIVVVQAQILHLRHVDI